MDFESVDKSYRTTDIFDFNHAELYAPQNLFELRGCLQDFKSRQVSYHVISQGHNWGYGDRNSKPKCQALLSLAKMNQILEFSESLGTVLIEPGVTQQQLAEYLKSTTQKWVLDCTGADTGASVVGNFLERGFGHTSFGDHEDHGKIEEAISPNGSIFKPHFSMFSKAHSRGLYQHDLGLNLEKLFYQTNFVIVTKYRVQLKRKAAKSEMAVILGKADLDIFSLIQKASELKQQSIINSIPHCANLDRLSKISGKKTQQKFSSVLTVDISGEADLVKLRRRRIKKAFSGYQIIFINEKRLKLFEIISRYFLSKEIKESIQNLKQLFNLLQGSPSDYFVQNSLKTQQSHYRAKTIWVSPLFPIQEQSFLQLKAILEGKFKAFGFDLPMTISLISDRVAVVVADITFSNNSNDENDKARTCYQETLKELYEQGFPVYRMGYSSSQFLEKADPFVQEIHQRIKSIFDSDNLLSPGRWIK